MAMTASAPTARACRLNSMVCGVETPWTPNTTDAAGRRYCFKNQPHIALWNLGRLANALFPVMGHEKPLKDALDHALAHHAREQNKMLAGKLGLGQFRPKEDPRLISDLFDLLSRTETDYTLFFRNLAALDSRTDFSQRQIPGFLKTAYYGPEKITQDYLDRLYSWLDRYVERLEADGLDPAEKKARMNRANPLYVLRNYLAQIAIEKAEKGDFSEIHALLDVMRRPYELQPGMERFAEKRPEWARNKPGCSMLSCSS